MASAGTIMLRSRYTDLFSSRLAYIDEILFENFDAPSLSYPKVFHVKDSGRAYEEVTGITGFGQFTEKDEGQPISYDVPLQGFDKRFTHLAYAKGYQISFEAMDDDLDGAITNAAPALARAARSSIEVLIWSVLNGGFATTTTPDGQALFSDTHLQVNGGTADNLLSGDLTIANLESAIGMFDNMVDDRDLIIDVEPSMLVIPPELRWTAHEILKSQLRSDTADNATNAFNQIGLQVVMSKYLTGDDDWFLMARPDQHRVLVYWRMEPVSDHTLDFDTGNFKTKMTFRLSKGASDWRGVVGGQGA